ncbi:hypothetical protein GXM_01162 [Nostoc sphaeroides CCNUC1]|uniref:Uncharacterized protein n=1 Tax=Nostoc sphaeroides CCNUC1 TaxID=2653204 RepID=A0A5P8VUT1_9NOSO|nr:hypothetical protein GXM_01162 [Nostoc sphaeroides CCNUC1]
MVVNTHQSSVISHQSSVISHQVNVQIKCVTAYAILTPKGILICIVVGFYLL